MADAPSAAANFCNKIGPYRTWRLEADPIDVRFGRADIYQWRNNHEIPTCPSKPCVDFSGENRATPRYCRAERYQRAMLDLRKPEIWFITPQIADVFSLLKTLLFLQTPAQCLLNAP